MITAFVKKELNTAEVNTFAKWLFNYFKKNAETAAGGVLKKLFLKFSQYSQEKPVLSLFFIQIITKFLRTPILKNICERLYLKMCSWSLEKFKKLLIRIFNST